jgi:sugar O-acyltransferase (sialic acid O-acetyltransferase NeuD family)
MNKEKVLIGAGGFAREVRAHYGANLKCFVDDKFYMKNSDEIYPLSQFDPDKMTALIVVGDPVDRKNIANRLPKETEYFTFIHKSAQILDLKVEIGAGSIITANCIITTNVKIGKHCHLNLMSTVGHDCIIGDFFTTAPGAKISGNCTIGECVYVGTNASIKEKLSIHSLVKIGLNSGVVKHIEEPGIYVGTPAKKIK